MHALSNRMAHLRLASMGSLRSITSAASSVLHNSALSIIGNTPVVKLQKVAPAGVDVYVKCEAFNPMLSMKDRLAVGLLQWAELNGKIRKGQTVIEALSGNTGIGMTLAAKEKGHPLVVVAPENSPVEWRKLMRFLGAKVLVTSNPLATAIQLTQQKGWFLARQFQSDANAWIHEQQTGPEILEAMGNRGLDYFVAPHGTGGMLKGIGQVLRDRSPHTKIFVVEQDSRPHPNYERDIGPHYSWPDEILRGWTTDFAPTPINEDIRQKYVDDRVTISGHESIMAARRLAQEECILTGISGGALAAGALQVAAQVPKGSSVLTILPDTSHFLFSTPLVQGTSAEMSEEELALLRETRNPPPTTEDIKAFILRVDAH